MCGRRYGQRILDCEYSGQAEPVQAAGAEDTGKQGDPVPQGGQPGLIFPGTSVPGLLLFSERKRIAVFALLGYHMEGL